MSRVIMWLFFGRWSLASANRKKDYLFINTKESSVICLYQALVRNNFCGSRNSAFIRRDMRRVLGLGRVDESSE